MRFYHDNREPLKNLFQLGADTGKPLPWPKPEEVSAFQKQYLAHTEITIMLGKMPLTIDPHRTMEIKWQDKVVGYIKGVRQDGDRLMADAVITDPEVAKQITP